MKVISYNIKGLNVTSKHFLLRKRIIQEKLGIIMLQETKCEVISTMILIAQKVWKNCKVIEMVVEQAFWGLDFLWDLDLLIL
jgi:exonuclease III